VLLANCPLAMQHASGRAPTPSPSTQPVGCALSIVIGSVNSARCIARALASFERACVGLDAEILIVDASTDATVERIAEVRPSARVRRLRPGTLTPALWSAGLAMSRGRVVAFTTGHCVVGEGWARALLAGLENGATGVAGSLSPALDSDVVDWGIFYLRYSAFLGAGEARVESAPEIPGDNAAYRRDTLERHSASFADGFWEVDFHRRLRRENGGTRLEFIPGADAQFGPSSSFAPLARQRFAHGRHWGAWRVEQGVRSAWQVVIAAPLVPLVLGARIARRVLRRPSHRVRFVLSLPVVLALAAAWAAGEAVGALSVIGMGTERRQGVAA
jgi:hypothetical protein